MRKQTKNRINGYHFEEIVFGSQNQLMDRALNSVLTKQGATVSSVKERAFAAFNRLFSMAKTPAEQDALRRAWSDPSFQARYPAEYQPYFQAFADEMGFTYNNAPSFNPFIDNDTYLATRNPGNNVERQDIRQRAQRQVGQKGMDARADELLYQRQREKEEEAKRQEQERLSFGYHNDMKGLFNLTREQYAALPDAEKTKKMHALSKHRKEEQQAAEQKKFEQQRAAVTYDGGFYEDGPDKDGFRVPQDEEGFLKAQQAWDVLETQTRNSIIAPGTIAKQKRDGTWTDEKQQRLDALVRAKMSRYGVRPAQPRYVPPVTPATSPDPATATGGGDPSVLTATDPTTPSSPGATSAVAPASNIRTINDLNQFYTSRTGNQFQVPWDDATQSYNFEGMTDDNVQNDLRMLQGMYDYGLSDAEREAYGSSYYQPRINALNAYMAGRKASPASATVSVPPVSSPAPVSSVTNSATPSSVVAPSTPGGMLDPTEPATNTTAVPSSSQVSPVSTTMSSPATGRFNPLNMRVTNTPSKMNRNVATYQGLSAGSSSNGQSRQA